MRLLFYTLYIAMIFLCNAADAYAQGDAKFSINLAKDHVDITTAFAGEDVVVYGVKPIDRNVIVTLEGPRHDVIVRRKENVLGAWINRLSVTFKDVPLYYDYALPEVWEEAENTPLYDVSSLNFTVAEDFADKEQLVQEFKTAYIKSRTQEGLYASDPVSVEKISDGFFKVSFHVPSNVPKGEYNVRAMLMNESNEVVLAEASKTVSVGQVGFSARVHKFAQKESLVYALLCVFIALVSGWLSNKIAKKS